MLALSALGAALVGAIGPAEHIRSTYSWPPPTLPPGEPSRAWYTPLLLTRHVPESLTLRVPCGLARPLPDAGKPVTVLATARHPVSAGGLEVILAGDRLTIRVGERAIARTTLAGRACERHLFLGHGEWLLGGEPGRLARRGVLSEMPAVFGVFSEIDLRAGPRPALELTTRVHGTRASLRQAVAWTLGVVAAITALLLVGIARRPVMRSAIRRGVRSAAAAAHLADGVVAAMLLGWWFLSPMFSDDGWVYARERMFSVAGGFSAYFAAFGVNYPLDYWLEWVEHWLAESTSALLFLRVPSLLCLAVTWTLCRFLLIRIAPREGPALWALAGIFLAGAMAWGMTLRPEPKIALLVTAVLVCMVLFVERDTAGPLAVAAALIPLALAAHQSGVVAIAPVVVVAPRLYRWARSWPTAASTIIAASIALAATLLFVGSDLDQRRADARATAQGGTSGDTWSDELHRYARLDEFPYGTPLRRASVALLGIIVVSFVIRRRRQRQHPLDVPTLALVTALLLLIATPSKWPWHFGSLIGFAAVAGAAETARLCQEATLRGSKVRALLVLAATSVAAVWAFGTRAHWSLLDLRTQDWTPAFESVVPLGFIAGAVPLVLVAAAVFRPRVAAWAAPALVVPVVAFSFGMLLTDSARSDSWTLSRQNFGALAARAGCGLGDDISPAPATRSLILPELLPYFPCTELPKLHDGVVDAPDGLVVPRGFLADAYKATSPFGGIFDLYEIKRASAQAPADVWVYRVVRRIPGAREALAVETSRP